ncbi:MAG: hypothetical protein ACE5JH_06330 [Acidobacteriota bacterium]
MAATGPGNESKRRTAGRGKRRSRPEAPPGSPIACDLVGFDERTRRQRAGLLARLNRSLRAIEKLADGYALCFNPDSSTLVDLVELIALERLCCPSLRFEMTVPEEGGPIAVRITGKEGTKAFLDAELDMVQGRGDA